MQKMHFNVKAFWDRVKARIKEKSLTQEHVSEVCRVPYTTLRNWMSKNMVPPLSNAYWISRLLGVSLEYLINGEGKDQISKTTKEALTLLKKAEEKLEKIRRNNYE